MRVSPPRRLRDLTSALRNWSVRYGAQLELGQTAPGVDPCSTPGTTQRSAYTLKRVSDFCPPRTAKDCGQTPHCHRGSRLASLSNRTLKLHLGGFEIRKLKSGKLWLYAARGLLHCLIERRN